MSNYYDEREHLTKAPLKITMAVFTGYKACKIGMLTHTKSFQDIRCLLMGVLTFEECWANGNIIIPIQWTKHNAQDSGYGGEAIHNMTRWDWGQDLFEWSEYYLKGVGENLNCTLQIQRNDGEWRIEPATWPLFDAQSVEQTLTDCTQTGQRVGGVSVVGGGLSELLLNAHHFLSKTDTLLSGLFTLHLDVTAAMDGGQIFAEMQDSETNLRLGRDNGHSVLSRWERPNNRPSRAEFGRC